MTSRRKAVENATKSLEIEGFSFSIEEKRLLEKVAKGELSPADLRTYAANKMTVREATA